MKINIRSIEQDSILTKFIFSKSLKEINHDSISTLDNLKIVTYTAYYSKENSLEKISISGPWNEYAPEFGPLITYYFKEEKIIGIHKKYVSEAYMGRCGAINFNFFLFFYNGKRIGIENLIKLTDGSFNVDCYSPIIDDQIDFEQLTAVLEIVNTAKLSSNR